MDVTTIKTVYPPPLPLSSSGPETYL